MLTGTGGRGKSRGGKSVGGNLLHRPRHVKNTTTRKSFMCGFTRKKNILGAAWLSLVFIRVNESGDRGPVQKKRGEGP